MHLNEQLNKLEQLNAVLREAIDGLCYGCFGNDASISTRDTKRDSIAAGPAPGDMNSAMFVVHQLQSETDNMIARVSTLRDNLGIIIAPTPPQGYPTSMHPETMGARPMMDMGPKVSGGH